MEILKVYKDGILQNEIDITDLPISEILGEIDLQYRQGNSTSITTQAVSLEKLVFRVIPQSEINRLSQR